MRRQPGLLASAVFALVAGLRRNGAARRRTLPPEERARFIRPRSSRASLAGRLTVAAHARSAAGSGAAAGVSPLADAQFTVDRRRVAVGDVGRDTRRARSASADDDRRAEYFAGQRWLPDDHVTGHRVRRRRDVAGDAEGLRADRVPADDAGREVASVRRARAGPPQPLGTDRGLASARARRLVDQPDGVERQRRAVDGDVRRGRGFRYKVTGEADARENARPRHAGDPAAGGDHRHPRFPGAIVHQGRRGPPARRRRVARHARQAWRWKGDTSSDEIVGHYFVYPIYHDLVADESEKPALRAAIERITNHILDNNYQLIDVDGKRTRGAGGARTRSGRIPTKPACARCTSSSHLRVAMHMTADARHRAKYPGGVRRPREDPQVPPAHPQPEDHGARAASTTRTTSWRSCRIYPLLRYETDPQLLEVYRQSLSGAGRSSGRSATRSGTSSTPPGPARRSSTAPNRCGRCARSRWTTSSGRSPNSHRLDVPMDPLNDRFQRRQALIVLPYDELPMTKWNGNPYNLDGGNGGRRRRRWRVLPAALLAGALSPAHC